MQFNHILVHRLIVAVNHLDLEPTVSPDPSVLRMGKEILMHLMRPGSSKCARDQLYDG